MNKKNIVAVIFILAFTSIVNSNEYIIYSESNDLQTVCLKIGEDGTNKIGEDGTNKIGEDGTNKIGEDGTNKIGEDGTNYFEYCQVVSLS